MKYIPLIFATLCIATSPLVFAEAPENFEQAKIVLRQKIFYDRNTAESGDLYCGCKWTWVGRSGGRMDLASCGYNVRAQENRAQRLEWEHVVAASALGSQRQCWQNGGRKNCGATDPVYRAMEADLNNLWASVGEVNADRSNFRYSALPSTPMEYGQCQTKVDFIGRAAEPRDEVKGQVARITLYMHDRYGLSMAKAQQQLMMAWDHQFPVNGWELERDRRITAVMGHGNPFVTGERSWSLGQKMSGEGLSAQTGQIKSAPIQRRPANEYQDSTGGAPVLGNRNSHGYHPQVPTLATYVWPA